MTSYLKGSEKGKGKGKGKEYNNYGKGNEYDNNFTKGSEKGKGKGSEKGKGKEKGSELDNKTNIVEIINKLYNLQIDDDGFQTVNNKNKRLFIIIQEDKKIEICINWLMRQLNISYNYCNHKKDDIRNNHPNKILCKFHTNNGYCNKGDKCIFIHINYFQYNNEIIPINTNNKIKYDYKNIPDFQRIYECIYNIFKNKNELIKLMFKELDLEYIDASPFDNFDVMINKYCNIQRYLRAKEREEGIIIKNNEEILSQLNYDLSEITINDKLLNEQVWSLIKEPCNDNINALKYELKKDSKCSKQCKYNNKCNRLHPLIDKLYCIEFLVKGKCKCLIKTQHEFEIEDKNLQSKLKNLKNELNILLNNVNNSETTEINKINKIKNSIDLIIDSIVNNYINYKIHVNTKINYFQKDIIIIDYKSKIYKQDTSICAEKIKKNIELKNQELYIKYIVKKIINFIKKCIKIKKFNNLRILIKSDNKFNNKNILHRKYILLFVTESIFEIIDYNTFISSNTINQIYIITGGYKVFNSIDSFVLDFNTTRYFYDWIESKSKLSYINFISYIKNKLDVWDNINIEICTDRLNKKKTTDIEQNIIIINKKSNNDLHQKYLYFRAYFLKRLPNNNPEITDNDKLHIIDSELFKEYIKEFPKDELRFPKNYLSFPKWFIKKYTKKYYELVILYELPLKKIFEYENLKKYINISILLFKQYNYSDFINFIKINKIIELICNKTDYKHEQIELKEFFQKKNIYIEYYIGCGYQVCNNIQLFENYKKEGYVYIPKKSNFSIIFDNENIYITDLKENHKEIIKPKIKEKLSNFKYGGFTILEDSNLINYDKLYFIIKPILFDSKDNLKKFQEKRIKLLNIETKLLETEKILSLKKKNKNIDEKIKKIKNEILYNNRKIKNNDKNILYLENKFNNNQVEKIYGINYIDSNDNIIIKGKTENIIRIKICIGPFDELSKSTLILECIKKLKKYFKYEAFIKTYDEFGFKKSYYVEFFKPNNIKNYSWLLVLIKKLYKFNEFEQLCINNKNSYSNIKIIQDYFDNIQDDDSDSDSDSSSDSSSSSSSSDSSSSSSDSSSSSSSSDSDSDSENYIGKKQKVKILYRYRNFMSDDYNKTNEHYYEIRTEKKNRENTNGKITTIINILLGPFRFLNKDENKENKVLYKNEMYLDDMIILIQNNKDGYSIIPKIETIEETDVYIKTYYIKFNNIKNKNDEDYTWLNYLFEKIFYSQEFIKKNIDPKSFLKCINGDATPLNINYTPSPKTIKNNQTLDFLSKPKKNKSDSENDKENKINKTDLIRQKLAEKKILKTTKKDQSPIKKTIIVSNTPKVINNKSFINNKTFINKENTFYYDFIDEL